MTQIKSITLLTPGATRMESKVTVTAKKKVTYYTTWDTEKKIDPVLRVGSWTFMDIAGWYNVIKTIIETNPNFI